MKPVFAAIILLGAAILLLGVKVFFVKGGSFPSGHAHDALRRRSELMAQRRPPHADAPRDSEKTE